MIVVTLIIISVLHIQLEWECKGRNPFAHWRKSIHLRTLYRCMLQKHNCLYNKSRLDSLLFLPKSLPSAYGKHWHTRTAYLLSKTLTSPQMKSTMCYVFSSVRKHQYVIMQYMEYVRISVLNNVKKYSGLSWLKNFYVFFAFCHITKEWRKSERGKCKTSVRTTQTKKRL